MNKNTLIKLVATLSSETQASTQITIDCLVDVIHAKLAAGVEVNIPDLGKFESRHRAARKGRNPKTGEPINIPEKRVPAFKPSKSLKDSLL